MTSVMEFANAFEIETDAYLSERTRLFLTAWLPTAVPDKTLDGMHLGYLQDLYATVWHHGPHGDTYATQLRYFRGELDRMRDEPGYLSPFTADLRGAFEALDIVRTSTKYEMIRLAQVAHILAPAGMTPSPLGDLWSSIMEHDLVHDQEEGSPRYGDAAHENLAYLSMFLEDFAKFSVFQDIIPDLPGDELTQPFSDYVRYCVKWGIPA